jgi:hypothetical protein
VSVRAAFWALPVLLAIVHAPPPPRLFALATLPRIRLDVARDHVVVIEEANLLRGDWPGGDFQLYVAFGAPGAPRALDARLYAGGEGGKDPASDAPSEPIVVESAVKRPNAAYAFLGSPSMAGVSLRIHEAEFRRAVGANGVARIRVRALYDLPEEDARSGREMIVRLGVRAGEPLALGRIEVASLEAERWLARAEAHLCGPEADPYPLAVALLPRAPHALEWPGPASPALTVRHATDDLCVRFWTSAP